MRADRFDERLEQYAPGDRVAVLVARRDRLLSLTSLSVPNRPGSGVWNRALARSVQRHLSCTDKVWESTQAGYADIDGGFGSRNQRKIHRIDDIGDFVGALVLFRLHGRPLGWGASTGDGRPPRSRALVPSYSNSTPGRVHCRWLKSGPHGIRRAPSTSARCCSRSAGVAGGRWLRLPSATALRPRNCSPVWIHSSLEYAPLDLVLVDVSDDRKNGKRSFASTIHRFVTPRRQRRPPHRARRSSNAAVTCSPSRMVTRSSIAAGCAHVSGPGRSEVMAVTGLTLLDPSGGRCVPCCGRAPFCREWLRVEGSDVAGALQQMLEYADVNIAFWQPGTSVAAPYTHVFEPAAIVRAATASPVPFARRRVPLTHTTRKIDLADALLPIADADGADDLCERKMVGTALGTAQVGITARP